LPNHAAVHIVTLGCPKNEVDSDRMAAALSSAGHTVAEDLDAAQVAVVNTCAFIQDATEQSIETVLALAGEWKSAEPGRLLVVAGCMASRYAADLPAEMPEVDAFVPVADEATIAEVVRRLLPGGAAGTPGKTAGVLRTKPGPSAYLMVSDGCFRECAFCTIPSIRGPYRSRAAGDLLLEARTLAAGGARELVLIGQDTSAYGRDLAPEADPGDLAGIVRMLSTTPGSETGVPGLDWLRLMYVQPDGLTDALLDAMAASPTVCDYLDLPLQHASTRVLRAMRRTGSADAFLALLERIRTAMPDARLRTTLIAGFPGETDADIELLLEFLEAARFDYVGVFPYSPEEGTEAFSLPGQLPQAERIARAQLVSDAGEAIGSDRVLGLVGETLDVLVEAADPDGIASESGAAAWVGRWRGQAPEIDGVVYFDGEARVGSIVSVRIDDAFGYDLIGEATRP
jgi:ribosomal protein S12 methylthiotransferase